VKGFVAGMVVEVKDRQGLFDLVNYDKVNREWCLKKHGGKGWVFAVYVGSKNIKEMTGHKAKGKK
jgi:hypothetical protein